MSETVLTGRGRQITEIPREVWEEHLSQVPDRFKDTVSFIQRSIISCATSLSESSPVSVHRSHRSRSPRAHPTKSG